MIVCGHDNPWFYSVDRLILTDCYADCQPSHEELRPPEAPLARLPDVTAIVTMMRCFGCSRYALVGGVGSSTRVCLSSRILETSPKTHAKKCQLSNKLSNSHKWAISIQSIPSLYKSIGCIKPPPLSNKSRELKPASWLHKAVAASESFALPR